jgi:hypothetical protein
MMPCCNALGLSEAGETLCMTTTLPHLKANMRHQDIEASLPDTTAQEFAQDGFSIYAATTTYYNLI